MVNLDFKQVMIYGPFLHEHPNSWMLLGFYKAFLYKRYNVIWINEERKELLNEYDLTNTLFITDGIHDEYIPLRHDSFYILFENNNSKYDDYNKLNIGLYGNDLPEYVEQWKDKFYIQYSLENKELYFPLATELLPNEILTNQQKSILTYPGDTRSVCVLGNITGDIVSNIFGDVKKYCVRNFYHFCVVNNLKSENRANVIKTCQLVPIILSQDQLDRDEIDYRLFQTISYGAFPVTNSQLMSNMFDANCIFYADTGKSLLLDGIDYKKSHFTDQWKWKVMENIKNNHTYVKRVDTIFWMLMRM